MRRDLACVEDTLNLLRSRLLGSWPSWLTNDFDDAWAGCNAGRLFALSFTVVYTFISFHAVGGFVTCCWPTKPKATWSKARFRSLSRVRLVPRSDSVHSRVERGLNTRTRPEQRPVMYLPEKRLAPLVLRNHCWFPFVLGCWSVVYCLLIFLYYVIWWLLPFATPRNYISPVTMYTGFPITLKQSFSRKQFRKYLVRFWTENTTATKTLRGRRERGNRVTGLIFSKTHPFITQNRPN